MPANEKLTFLPELTLDQIKEGLQQTFPTLVPNGRHVKLLNDGFSSFAVLVADEFILRIAKHAQAMAGHTKEQAILPLLQKHLPIQVPQSAWRAERSDAFPFGVLGYRAISGIPFVLSLAPRVELKPIAQDLAQFLMALHHIPLAEMGNLEVSAADELESLWADVMPTLSTYLGQDEDRMVRRRRNELDYTVKDSFTPKLIHGDPWGENIILNDALNSVVGMVDFETVSIGDIAQDFAALKYLGADFLSQVIEHYQAIGGELESHFGRRLQGYSMLRELRGLRYAMRYPESGELIESLQKVRDELSLSA